LAGALIASFYLGEFSLPRVAISGTLRSLLFFVGFNVLFGTLSPGIDNGAHVGGLVSGLILGALIARVAPEHDKPLRRAGILLFMVLIVGGSALGVQRWRGSGMRFGSATDAQRSIDRMIGELQKKVQQSPQDASSHYSLAHAYFSKGQFPEGESELKRVLDLEPQNAKARMELGARYLNQEQSKEAQEEFTKLVAQEPNNANAHVGLGMALADQNNHEVAINEYKTALRLEPRTRDVYYRMGVSQAQLKQYDDAIASFLKERDASGDDPELETALADTYQAKGMAAQAQEARNKAAELRGQNTD
jgi:tetratricopeptide (TPR) repeat protein